MTKIEWAHAGLGRGKTWNPIRANNDPMGDPTRIGWHCEKVSPACEHCYAERQNIAGARGGTKYPYKPGHRANGNIHVYLEEKTLLAPLSWRQPTGIFVCSMSDAFGDWVLDEWLDKMFAVAALRPQHRFIWLTKRSKRMREYFEARREGDPWAAAADAISDMLGMEDSVTVLEPKDIPLPNVWLGVTAEDQPRADERIPDLLATPAAVRFVSCEPLLGGIDLRSLDINGEAELDALNPKSPADCWREQWAPEITGTTLEEAIEGFEDWGFSYPPGDKPAPRLDLVISGGETGPGSRPTPIDAERALRDQCAAAGVPYFRKQAGDWQHESQDASGVISAGRHRFHVWPDGTKSYRVGKRRAGRMLDGVEHNAFPEPGA